MSDRLLLFPGQEPPEGLAAALEALLFAAGAPVSVKQLSEVLECPADTIGLALELLREGCEGRGVQLVEVSGGWQLRTRPEHAALVLRLLKKRPARLSRAALEVLSVVAWRQPVTRAEIESLRGVDSGGVVKSLIERGLLRTAGRRAEPGRPLMYATTRAFLEMFELGDLRDLPTLREREELEEDS